MLLFSLKQTCEQNSFLKYFTKFSFKRTITFILSADSIHTKEVTPRGAGGKIQREREGGGERENRTEVRERLGFSVQVGLSCLKRNSRKEWQG